MRCNQTNRQIVYTHQQYGKTKQLNRTADVRKVQLVVVQDGWFCTSRGKVAALHDAGSHVGPIAEVELPARPWLYEPWYRSGCTPYCGWLLHLWRWGS